VVRLDGLQAVLGSSVAVLGREAITAFSLLLESGRRREDPAFTQDATRQGPCHRQSVLRPPRPRSQGHVPLRRSSSVCNEGHSANSSFTLKAPQCAARTLRIAAFCESWGTAGV